MKRFIAVISAFILLLALLLGAVDIVYIRKERPLNEVYKFYSMPERIELCNFGSSHGRKAYCYDDIAPDASFNFGLTSQTLSYDYLLMQNYADRIAPGATVFITISYFSLYGLTDETETEDFEAKNRRYYRIMDDEYIKEYDRKTDIYMNVLPAFIDTGELIEVLTGTRHDDNQEWYHVAYEIDVAANAEIKYENHIVKDKYDESGHRVINEEELRALYDMIGYCQAHGWRPVLITPPFTEEYLSLIHVRNPGFLEEFDALVRRISDETGAPYYNYGEDARFTHDLGLFIDADHMNIDGAKKFTAILTDEVLGAQEEIE